MSEKFVLYNYFRSSPSYRVRIALYYKKMPFQYVGIPLLKGEQKNSDYLEKNRMAEVPTLLYQGQTLTQSLVILQYLDELQPQPPLFPKDLFDRMKVLQFCEDINSAWHPVTNLKVLQRMDQLHKIGDTGKKDWAQFWSNHYLKIIEKNLELSSGNFCFKDTLTAADLCLIPALFSAERFGVSLADYPNAAKIKENCLKLECFQQAHPMKQPDYFAD